MAGIMGLIGINTWRHLVDKILKQTENIIVKVIIRRITVTETTTWQQ